MDDDQLQALADRLANEVLDAQLRPNAFTRYGNHRQGALATAAVLAGTVAAAGGVVRRLIGKTDLFETERLYAKVVAVDRDRAHDDVYYVGQRLRLLAMVTDDDPDELVRGAARALVAFVTAGRPPIHRLNEVEQA